MTHTLDGTGVAIVTPFTKKGNVDVPALVALTQHIVKGGVEYIVILGTTGESVTLTKDEKQLVINTIRTTVKNKCKLVLGVGGNNTQEVIDTIKSTDFTGITAILSVSPYYNKPGQRGIIEHYKAIEKKCPLPIILYNVPGRTGQSMTPETILTLANHSTKFTAVKEASGSVEQAMAILHKAPKHFAVISGDDPLTLPMMAVGARGVISVAGNAYPKQVSDMVRLALKGTFDKAAVLHYQLLTPTNLMFMEGNPAGIKEFLQYQKITDNHVRLPLVTVGKELSSKIKKALL
ncbi:MAG: 4-hydroxy-tetrahydrodipicolinate synthase [Bacteroidia bacterium]